jgi:preprotein translocase subunit YajC
MEWIKTIFNPSTLVLLIPILAIVGSFAVVMLKAHHKHQERIEKIKHGVDPDN